MSDYVPEYAKGQIIVFFKKDHSFDFVQEFANTLGYSVCDSNFQGKGYVIGTENGQEEYAITHFQSGKYSEFVDSACRRDVKVEDRWSDLEQLIYDIRVLNDSADEYSDVDYIARLEGFIDYCQELIQKEKNRK